MNPAFLTRHPVVQMKTFLNQNTIKQGVLEIQVHELHIKSFEDKNHILPFFV